MASLTITIGSNTDTKTISNADITRIISSLKTKVGNQDLTNSEAFDIIVSNIHIMLKELVTETEGFAAKAAIVSPSIT